MNPQNTELLKHILMFFFIFFWLLNSLLLMKLFYEINRFNKIDKLKRELEFFKSFFFTNKLIEIKNFSLKNKEYKKIYNYLFNEYINLIVIKNDEIIKKFINNFEKENNVNSFIIESKVFSNIYNDFEINKKKIIFFCEELKIIFALENIVFSRINLLNLILDKTLEELNKLELIFDIDIEKIKVKIKSKIDDLSSFELNIYQLNNLEIEEKLETISKDIYIFVEKVIIWIKTISLFETFRQKQTELIKLIEDKKYEDWFIYIQKFNRYFQKINIELFYKIESFLPKKTKQIILKLLLNIENEIYQIKNVEYLKKMFDDSFKFIKINLKLLESNFFKFDELLKNFNNINIFTKLQNSEYKNFKKIIYETKKEVKFLIIDELEIKNKNFLNNDLFKIETILNNLAYLFDNLPKMINLFNAEKQKNNEMFITLINIKTIFLKDGLFYIKKIYHERYKKIMNNFLNFKKNQNSPIISDSSNLIVKHNVFLINVRSLKEDIKKTILLKNIADNLFVKVNKFRFNNDFSRNKILNTEILFIKYDFKNVIEKLIEIYDHEKLIWKN